MQWDFYRLAEALIALTPKLKKDNKWAYADSRSNIEHRLESFAHKFPRDYKTYSEEDVIEAYKRYLKDTTNIDGSIDTDRRLLKYFIWKKQDDGDIWSDLSNYLESDLENYGKSEERRKGENDRNLFDTVI